MDFSVEIKLQKETYTQTERESERERERERFIKFLVFFKLKNVKKISCIKNWEKRSQNYLF